MMKIYLKEKGWVFHLIPFCCAEQVGTRKKNYLWLFWFICFI